MIGEKASAPGKSRSTSSLAVLGSLLVACPATRAGNAHEAATRLGKPLNVANPGFEADFADPGCFALLTPFGWDAHDPDGILGDGDYLGVLDPTGTTNFPGGAPEGNNVALVFLDGQVGGGPMGVTQVLADTLQANTSYVLTVQVGDIASGQGPPPCDVFGFFDLDGFPGYQVQLLAGGVLIGQDDNSLAAVLNEGEFALSAVTVNVGETHPQLGQALEIRLINLNTPGTPQDPGIEVDFDDVMLTAQPAAAVPTASRWGLLALILGLAAVGTLVLRPKVRRVA